MLKISIAKRCSNFLFHGGKVHIHMSFGGEQLGEKIITRRQCRFFASTAKFSFLAKFAGFEFLDGPNFVEN